MRPATTQFPPSLVPPFENYLVPFCIPPPKKQKSGRFPPFTKKQNKTKQKKPKTMKHTVCLTYTTEDTKFT